MFDIKRNTRKYLRLRLFAGFSTTLALLIAIIALSGLSKPVANAATTSQAQIPTTNYPVPTGAIFVSPNNTNTGDGSITSPYKTLSSAISNAQSGGTIVLRGGIYREGNLNVYKKIKFQAYPGEQAWIDGSNIITNWVNDSAGGFRLDNSPSATLCKVNCVDNASQIDNARNTISNSPQMVFVNDIALTEVDSREKAISGNNFYFNPKTNSIYIGVNPTGQKVEVTVRNKAMNISQTANGTSILGIGIRRFGSTLTTNGVPNASNVNEWNFAAIQVSGNSSPLLNISNITIENSLFTQNASRGLYLGYIDNSKVVNNIFISNGANGFDINRANLITVSGNNISLNNTEKFNTVNGTYAVIAGSKMVALTNSTIKENVVDSNDGEGLWCDLACINVKYYSNIIKNNTGRGIFYEVSTSATIASNIITNNAMGIAVHGPNSKIINNTIYKNGEGIGIFEDGRTPPNDPYSNNRSNEILNNIIYGSNASSSSKNVFGQYYKLLDIFGMNLADSATPNLMVTALDYNSYYRENNSTPMHVFGLSGNNVYQNFNTFSSAKTTLNTYGFENNGYASDNATNEILFVDATNNNFTIKSGSKAKDTGKTLNSNSYSYIATDLGLNPSALIDRGAISWPGKISENTTTSTSIILNTIATAPTSVPNVPQTVISSTTSTTTTKAPTTTTTTTTIAPTTTKVPTTTTTKAPTTTIVPPTVQSNLLALDRIKSDHDLAAIKQTAFKNSVLYARAYFKKTSFFFVAADIIATINSDGTYTMNNVSLILSITPIP